MSNDCFYRSLRVIGQQWLETMTHTTSESIHIALLTPSQACTQYGPSARREAEETSKWRAHSCQHEVSPDMQCQQLPACSMGQHSPTKFTLSFVG